MLTESAVVVNAGKGRALVRTYRGEACESCAAAGACKVMGGGKDIEVEVLNFINAKQGDRVELSLPEASFLKVSMITYAVPLTAFMGGAILGQVLTPMFGWSKDGMTIILSSIGLVLAFLVVSWVNGKVGHREKFIPRITRILPQAPEEETLDTAASGQCTQP